MRARNATPSRSNPQRERGVTGRRSAESRTLEALRESEHRLQLALDAAEMGMWDWDLATDTLRWSERQFGLFGIPPEGFARLGAQALERIHPEDRPRVQAAIARAMRTPEAFREEFRVVLQDGEVRWLAGLGRPVADCAGRANRMIGVNFDITERKRAEAKLREHEQQLREHAASLEWRIGERTMQLRRLAVEATMTEERERRAIAMDLHDDLGQLLHVAKLQLGRQIEQALGRASRAPLREIDRMIDEASAKLRSLSAQLSPPVLAELGLVPALSWLAEEMQRGYGLAVAVHDDGAPKPLDEARHVIVFRAVRELLVNVAKHAGTPSARIETRVDGDRLVVVVSDSGVGMGEGQAGGNSQRGLGLFSVRERVAFLGGEFRLKSVPGGGTVATITLPLAARARSAAEPAR